MSEYLFVGKNIPRTAEVDKVTGRAIYINDLKRPRMLYGKIKYSEYAHAKIKRIDTSKAKKLSGVRAVLTGEVDRAPDELAPEEGGRVRREGWIYGLGEGSPDR